MKERFDTEREGHRSKMTLCRAFDIPIEELDFRFVESCNDAKRVERILRILRSGEEGVYPDLEAFTERRLEILNPKSPLLRKETPLVKSSTLDTDQRVSIEEDLQDWLKELATEATEKVEEPEIFNEKVDIPIRGDSQQIIRDGQVKSIKSDDTTFVKQRNPNRIKSWEYSKWDSFDVDAEVAKLDVEELQKDEVQRSNGQKKSDNETLPPSYIEEIKEPQKCPKLSNLPPKPQRRIKIHIDDIHIGG